MVFSSTIELTCVVLESVNLVSNVGFAEVRGRIRQVWTFSGVFPIFRRFGGNIVGHKDYFPFVIFIFCMFGCTSTISSLLWVP